METNFSKQNNFFPRLVFNLKIQDDYQKSFFIILRIVLFFELIYKSGRQETLFHFIIHEVGR